jgi:alpha-glucosidase (family GH31 glycosyl hydrolase)
MRMTKTLKIIFLFALVLIVFAAFFGCSGGDDDDDSGSSISADDSAGDDTANDTSDDTGDDTAAADDDSIVVGSFDTTPPPWPEWVLKHWVWEDESTQASATQYVDDYLANDIPVGAVIIDSPWETGYNTFVFDSALFPDPQTMIDDFHAKGVRVFLWTTANVNTDSPNYEEGYDAGYYINNGKTLEWWKGDGSFIDYWNPDALDWWHAQLDNVLDMGIDGWKTDGSEFSLYLWLVVNTFDGQKLVPEYQAAYYRDFFEYSRERLGNDRVITARPVDSYGIPWGPSFAPRDVNFAGWVGDQDPDFAGMRCALINMFMSGNRGYVNFGSDIGGYRESDLVDGMRDKTLFIRWAQLGAFSPIMENGGGGEHRPWMYDEEVLGIYRDFAKLHHALIPYMYSQGAVSYRDGLSLFRPMDRENWEYMLGDSLYVAAMTDGKSTRTVHLPEGVWIHLFTDVEYAGGAETSVEVPLDSFPVFVKKGAIVPMDQREDGAFDGQETETPPYTVHLYPDDGQHEFLVFEEKGTGAKIKYTYAGGGLRAQVSATNRAYAFAVHGAKQPVRVRAEPAGDLAAAADLSTLSVSDTGYYYAKDTGVLWIKPGSAGAGVIVTVR